MRTAIAAFCAVVCAAACSSDVVVRFESRPSSTTLLVTEQPGEEDEREPSTTAPRVGDDARPEPIEFPEEFEDQVRQVIIEGEFLPALVDPHGDESVGMPIPSLIGENFDGDVVAVRPTDGVATLVVFLAHWCPHCNNEIPEINRIRDAEAWPSGLRVVGVSTAVAPQRPNFPPQRWLAGKDWTYDVIADAYDADRSTFIAAEAFGVTGFPFMVLIDESGLIRGRWGGEVGALALAELVTSLIDPPADV
ncbi:MAG: TlpA family protein disulfide reductase [Ilumatobacteraceae bacterium]|nr:TlpA family protein disulfide reductase [Ilumatobacteraceae bacterium]